RHRDDRSVDLVLICVDLRMRKVRHVVRSRYWNDLYFDHLQFGVQLLTVTRHDRLRPLFVGFVHALFDPLFTIVNPHWASFPLLLGVSEVDVHTSIGLPARRTAKQRDFSSFYGWFRQMVYGRCPRTDSVRPIRGSAVRGLEMCRQLPVGVAA